MKKLFAKMRPVTFALLAAVIIITSIPQTGTHTQAASPADTENAVSLQDESDAEDTDSSRDGSDSEESIPAYTAVSETENAADYPLDDTLGYTLTNISMSPGSYSAHFSATLSPGTTNYLAASNFTVLYTTDQTLSFFPQVSHAAKSDVSSAGFSAVSLQNASLQVKTYETYPFLYELEGDLIAENSQPLTPDTTYYYRIAFVSASEYYFLTAPKQFTTAPPIETSAVKITDLQAESIGYNSAKIIWTVENPNQEYIYNHRLYITDLSRYYSAYAYRDEDGNIIPGKYYAIARPLGKTAIPRLTVYTGEASSTVISPDEPLTIEPADISQASVTASVQPSVYTAGLQIQITPWHEYDTLYGYLFYRAAGDTNWNTGSFSVTSSTTFITEIISGLSSETDYEYYVTLNTTYITADYIASIGSDTEPLSFATEKLETYEDNLFPDDVFRNWIKEQMGLEADTPITNEAISRLTSLNWYWRTGDDAIHSLEGIQYLTNLNIVSIRNHEITELPDLSGLTNLQTAYFDANKIDSGITADKLPASFLKANPSWLSDTAKAQRLPAKTPTQAEINSMFSELSYDIALSNTYAVNPSVKSPYAAGRLSDDSLNNALNLLNFSRYVAGIPSDVVLNESYIQLAQAGTLVNAVNGVMTHYPEQPSGFPDDLYEQGYTGCSRSNIARGYSTLGYSIANGWLYDGDSSNIDRLGHRRWVLNPAMSATGFGAVNSYSAMYALDSDNHNVNVSDFVAWPARNMPLELVTNSGYPWSVSLGTDYQIGNTSAVSVTLKDTASGKTWSFDQKTSSYSGNYFSISSAGYGSGTCIVFRPKTSEISYADGSQFEVAISGLQDRFGEATSLNYTVNFFSLNKTDVSIRLNQTSLKLSSGQSTTLTATVTPEESDTPIVWSSSNPDVATVDESGTVTAITPGDAVITASYKGKRATCKVTVRDYSIDRTELLFNLAEGTMTETLTVSDGLDTVTDVTWSSTDESVAAVSKRNGCGVVTPTGAGTAQIQAEVKNGPSFTCVVTVKKDILTAISFNTQECSLEKGASRQLKVYYVPHDTTLSKELIWTSDHPDVASVDTTGTITALSKGTAVITASTPDTVSAGTLTAQCTVIVTETAAPAQDNIPSGLQALTNVQTRLSDISLKDYEGWEWENGDISLAQFAGMQEKSFAAVYHQEGYADYKTALNVSLATLTGISIAADRTTLGQNETAGADIQWKLSGSEAVLYEYTSALQWSSSNPAILEVTAANPDTNAQPKVILKAGNTAGKATVTAQLTLGGKTYTARQNFTVVNGNIAVFENITADGFEPVAQEDINLTCYQGNLETQTGSLLVTVSNTTKLTAKSSNAKVVSVGKIQSEDGSFRIPLTMKAAGTAKLTLTANDAAKTKTEILLYVKDPRPNLGESTVTVNKLQTSGSTLFIYPNDGYTVTGYELTGTDAACFEALTPGSEPDSYYLKAKQDTAKGSYKLTVKVTTAADNSDVVSYELPLTVKVTEQAPKYKLKQSAKANVFYKDLGAPQITVTTDETLTGLTLTDCDFKLTESGTDTADSYTLIPDIAGTLTSSCNTKGTLTLNFEGYEPISTSYTVGIENKKPKLALNSKTVTLYPNAGVTAAGLQVKSGSLVLDPNTFTTALQNADGCTLTQTDSGLTVSVAEPSDTEPLSQAATLKAKVTLTHDNWAEIISLPLTVKLNPGIPAIKLQKSSLQLNANAFSIAYDMAETEVLWKDGAWFDPDTDISVSAANAKSQAIINEGIVFEQAGNKVLARLNNQNIAAGSYKFKLHIVGMPGSSASLTVKIVNTDLTKAVKLSSKGSIDILNRSGSFVTVTPSLKSLNGTITDVMLSGDFAHLFQAELSENNKILIYARETDANGKSIALITKYNYPVKLILTLQNAEGETMSLTTSELKLKLKQGKPKVTAIPKNPVFCSGAYNSVNLTINATLKGADNPDIVNIELINQTDLFNYSDGILTLRNTGSAIKGKTYSLQFRITFRGQADNEKATMIKVNAKVK